MVAKHGRSKYTNDGCRCTVCTGDWAAYTDKRRRQRQDWTRENGLPSDVEHGYSAYHNWGCRCTVCTTAERDRARSKREAS